MYKKPMSILMLVVLSLCITSNAYAAKFTSGGYAKQSLTFLMDATGVPVPAVATFRGDWKEEWDGTKGGWATLNRLYHSGMTYSYRLIPFGFELEPEAEYNDGQTKNAWRIVYPYNWSLQNPADYYVEGYNNPGTYYNNPNVKGYVYIFTDAFPSFTKITGSWVQ